MMNSKSNSNSHSHSNSESSKNKDSAGYTGMEIAVIGMDCRFPGVKNIEEYWHILENGIETISFYTDEELIADGVDPRTLKDPNYVKAGARLADVEYFDASFFGYTPSEGQIMDPQMRIFHECVWHTMEDAGYDPLDYHGAIGMYAGGRENLNWTLKTMLVPNDGSLDAMSLSVLSSKEHLGIRMSYMFNLKGPSYTFFTACSTSLVGVHLACQAILSGECDMALTGGITAPTAGKHGYTYEPGMVHTSDGHTRTFDAQAEGMVDSCGVGVVLLKPLEDAIRDRDHIYAVVKGTGINNDGNRKIGYTAPSILGQETLLREVYKLAEVDPESITMVECHGTATPLGDPIEVEALRRVLDSPRKNYCALGSVKTNFGHADCAAGVAGFIKAALALYHKTIPPSLNFKTPNPKIDFLNSPFYVNTEAKKWVNDEYPLRAGVTALGLGGTNAHVILEEAPAISELPATPALREYKLLTLSAKTATALDKTVENLRLFLEKYPDTDIADVAYTLQVGRRAFACRRTFACPDTADAVRVLTNPAAAPVQPSWASEKEKPIVFMFSGQGTQYVNMGLDLYKKEKSFRDDIENGFKELYGLIREDLKYILYPGTDAQLKEAEEKIHRIYYTQPVKFIYETSMARLLMRWGLVPHAMVGHSFGEYVAAYLSGVFTLEDALKLVMIRGELLEKAQPGFMTSVSLPQEELIPLLNPTLSLAAVNTDDLCLVSGAESAVEAFEKVLEQKNIEFLRLRVSRAGHSPLMEPILDEFRQRLGSIAFQEPKILFISGITGTWITKEEALSPVYWTRHLREPILFAHALKTLFKTPNSIFVEVGAGTGLTNFVNRYKETHPDILTVNMVRHYKDTVTDDLFLLNRVGQFWAYGRKIDWNVFYGEEKRRRLSIPRYPFERQYYWIDLDPFKAAMEMFSGKGPGRKGDIKDWFYTPSWKAVPAAAREHDEEGDKINRPWMIFMDREKRGEMILDELEKMGKTMIVVEQGEKFTGHTANRYSINPTDLGHYMEMFKSLKSADKIPSTIIHLWNLGHIPAGMSRIQWNNYIQDMGFYTLLNIAAAFGRLDIGSDLKVEVVTDGLQGIAGQPVLYPEKATVMGPVKNIPQEYPNFRCRTMDIVLPERGTADETLVLRQLINEFLSPQTSEQIIAFRGRQRLVQHYVPVSIDKPATPRSCFKHNGVYLIVGGLGGVGLTLATFLAREFKARLILTSRSGLPPKTEWNGITHEKTLQKIDKIRAMEELGAQVLISAVDTTDETAMKEVIGNAKERFGAINGVIHCGYVADGTIIDQRTRETSETVFAPKIKGTMVLDTIFEKEPTLDFFVFCSSLASIFGPLGQVAYTSANAFEDAYAFYRMEKNRGYTMSINWSGWAEVGGAAESAKQFAEKLGRNADQMMEGAIVPDEGIDAFARVMGIDTPQILVSPSDVSFLTSHLNTAATSVGFQESLAEVEEKKTFLQRPHLSTDFVAPRKKTEEAIASIWQNLFGYETIGINDNFFELGGDSLKAMTVASRIQKEMSIKIPVAVFFSSPTIEELAQYLNEPGKKEASTALKTIPIAPAKEFYPTSSAQRRMFILHHMEVNSTGYNVPSVMVSEERLDKTKLENAFRRLVQRHESFRTSFHLVDDQPMQKIHTGIDFEVQYFETKPEEVLAFSQSLITPFDLGTAPLLRVALIHLLMEENKDVLFMDCHHIVTDGTSGNVFMRELTELYAGKELPPVTLQYKDYAQWQYDRFESGELAEVEGYWVNHFKEPVIPLNLPTDFPRPPVQDFEGKSTWFDLDSAVTQQLRALARQTEATMFMLMMAAYTILLHKYTGQDDIVIGTPTAGRPHADLEQMIGMFANTLAVRTRPTSSKIFADYVKEIKKTSLDAFKYQEYPFEELIDRINYRRDPSRSPLFDTMLVFNRMQNPQPGAGTGADHGPSFTTFGAEKEKTPYDILFQATEMDDSINCLVQYSTTLFKPETIHRLSLHFRLILQQVIENPGVSLADIGIVTEEERQQLLESSRAAQQDDNYDF